MIGGSVVVAAPSCAACVWVLTDVEVGAGGNSSVRSSSAAAALPSAAPQTGTLKSSEAASASSVDGADGGIACVGASVFEFANVKVGIACVSAGAAAACGCTGVVGAASADAVGADGRADAAVCVRDGSRFGVGASSKDGKRSAALSTRSSTGCRLGSMSPAGSLGNCRSELEGLELFAIGRQPLSSSHADARATRAHP